MQCSCDKNITHIFATWGYDAAFIGAGISTETVGWGWALKGHCGNGCESVNLGRTNSLLAVSVRYPNARIMEAGITK